MSVILGRKKNDALTGRRQRKKEKDYLTGDNLRRNYQEGKILLA